MTNVRGGFSFWLLFGALVASGPTARADDGLYLGSKTTYAARQDPSTYEAPPPGFTPVFVETVARHGSRGLSSASSDLAMYDMWTKAQAAGALTKIGARLGPDIQRITRANALLGYGVAGITTPGYGNLTQVGIAEHQQLAARLAGREGSLFTDAIAQGRQVIVATSGQNRAVDSGNFFTGSLAATVPGLAPLILNAAPLTIYPVGKPKAQAAGVNRFELYFHKLNATTDLPASTDPYYPIYGASLNYQSYLAGTLASPSGAAMASKVNGIVYSDASKSAARAVLLVSFSPAFVNSLDAGTTSYANIGSFTFTSDDGNFTTTITGDGTTKLANLVDAANALYAVYAITPAMVQEVPVNIGKYIPSAQLPTLAYLSDAQDFYQKGPGIQEDGAINSSMGQALLTDFFREADAIVAGNLAHVAKLRFTHAEIIIPFATLLRLPSASTPVPAAATYTYDDNPWRGDQVATLAANVQWDFVRNGGAMLVKMYYNEQETDFPAACESARYLAGTTSHYYNYAGIKSCYGY